jgi:hypothetical protein
VLAKVPKKRIDGRSTFGSLIAYISAHASAVVCSDSLWSAETAPDEMAQVSLMNERVKDPVYHYILSWPGSELPSDASASDAVKATLRELNMIDHQWVAAIHRNTKNVHAHVAANRVHPRSFASVYPRQDWIVLDRVCRALELEHGWHHDRGPNSVDYSDVSSPRIVRDRDRSTSKRVNPSTIARDFTAWTGLENFQSWVAREPADHVRRVLDTARCRWQDVHDALDQFNLEYRPRGSGAVVVDRDDSERFHAKASHLGRFASRSKLEAQLGPYTARQKTIDQSTEQIPSTRAAKRLAVARYRADRPNLERALGRATCDALHERYIQSRASVSTSGGQGSRLVRDLQRQSESARLGALKDENRSAREKIRQVRGPAARRLLYSQHAWTTAGQRERLRDEIAQERDRLRGIERAARHPSWREWLCEQATAGDDLARRRLRGMRFRERRGITPAQPANEIGSVVGSAPSKIVSFDQYRAVADRQGLNYVLGSGVAFRDEGLRVTFYNASSDVLRAGLLLCREKWGSELKVTGFGHSLAEVRTIGEKLGITIVGPNKQRVGTDLESQNRSPKYGAADDHTRSEVLRKSLEQLSRDLAKLTALFEGKPGARHTGKIVAVLADVSAKQNIVVLDVGRELGIVHVDSHAANDCLTRIGEVVVCRWASQTSNLRHCWQFHRVERTGAEPQLER